MTEPILRFYDELAEHYHLIFDDWESSIQRQAKVLGPLLSSVGSPLRILDCACGIGTQALGLAGLGHLVAASDLSAAAVERARSEARLRSLAINFHVADMRSLAEIAEKDFDAVVALDNALPHLSPDGLGQAARAIAAKLRPNGLFVASIRDYDTLMLQRPAMQQPAFYGTTGNRRIVHQAWDWIDERKYLVHLYITTESEGGWETRHFVSEYFCLLREELSALLQEAGFADIRWLLPAESGFYQPLVLAR